MEKRKLMIRIHDLLDSCSGCDKNKESLRGDFDIKCAGCRIYEEIRTLRTKLDGDIPRKAKRILAKGQDMTTNDIRELIEKHGVQQATIRRALGTTPAKFTRLIHDLGIGKKEDDSMSMSDLTVDEYVQLHYIEGKAPKEIAEIKGIARQSVYHFRYYNKEKIEKVLKEKGLPKRPVNKRKPKEEKKVTNESKQKDELLLVAKDENSNLELELEEIKKSFQKTMEENRELRNYNAALKAKLEEVSADDYSLEKIQQENRLLKELIKLYI